MQGRFQPFALWSSKIIYYLIFTLIISAQTIRITVVLKCNDEFQSFANGSTEVTTVLAQGRGSPAEQLLKRD